MAEILHAFEDRHEFLHAIACELHQSTGWRWVGIGQFVKKNHLELMAWLDAGTVCKIPSDSDLAFMTARSYVASAIGSRKAQPLGHVFMMDPRSDLDMARAKEFVRMAAAVIGAQIRIQAAERVAREALHLAVTDPLTRLTNRAGFERDARALEESFRCGDVSDALVAIIDLDGTKLINDNHGHSAGDEYLRSFAALLEPVNRSTDALYRIGGDELAMLLRDADMAAVDGFRRRIALAVQGVRERGFPNADASAGFASLAESRGDVSRALGVADARMYAEKREKRKAG